MQLQEDIYTGGGVQTHTLWASGRRQRNNKMTMNRNIKLDIKNLTDKITA